MDPSLETGLTPESARFFLPGPTAVRQEVLMAQTAPMMGHRDPGIVDLMGELQDGLRYVFRTERPIAVSTSSATGLMEAGIRCGVERRLLALVNGAFSERFAKIAEACGRAVDRLEVPWGEIHTPELVAEELRSGDYDAVTVVHSETSTGALNPVEEISRVVHASSDVLLLVDSVSGLGGAPLHADDWELDFVLTGTQKALAAPPGLAFGASSPALLERAARIPGRGVYFDLLEFDRRLEKLHTPNTPALSLMYALRKQLERIRTEGMEERWARHCRMAERTWRWVDEVRERSGLELSVLAPEGGRSPTVTCIRVPGDVDVPEVVAGMKERGFVIAKGYGRLAADSIRIGHMGEHTVDELESLLDVLEEVLTG